VKFNNSAPKVLRVKSTDPNQVIVGFKLSFEGGFRPSWLKLYDRKILIKTSRAYMLPLKRSELLNEESVIEFGGNPNSDTTCEYLGVFVVPRSSLPTIVEDTSPFDWMMDATDLFDYEDSRLPTIKGPLLRIGNLCSLILNPNGEELDDETIRTLVNLMYTSPDNATFCRRMIVKGVKDRDKGMRIWAGEIRRLVVEKAVHKQAWGLLWRDLALLPVDVRKEILNQLWDTEPEISGFSALLCAFCSG
jgi:hypothetical protein